MNRRGFIYRQRKGVVVGEEENFFSHARRCFSKRRKRKIKKRLYRLTQTEKQSNTESLKEQYWGLLCLFINDLTYSVDDAKLRLYADDTTLYISHPNQARCVRI